MTDDMNQVSTCTAFYDAAETLADHLRKNRQEAETKWQRNHDAYRALGASDAWRPEKDAPEWFSKRFLNLTKQKVSAAEANIANALFRGGQALPLMLLAEETDLNLPDEVVDPVVDAYTEKLKDFLSAFKADRQALKVIVSSLVYGDGFAKKTVMRVPRNSHRVISPAAGVDPSTLPLEHLRFERFTRHELVPAFLYVPVWSVYVDAESDRLEDARMVMHERWMAHGDLRAMVLHPEAYPGVLPEAIARVLRHAATPGTAQAEGMDWTTSPPAIRDLKHRYRTIHYREMWGMFDRVTVERFENALATGADDYVPPEDLLPGDEIPCMVCLADEEVVRLIRLERPEQPFFRVRCEETIDTSYATGVADAMESTQAWVNDVVRMLENNTRLSGLSMLLYKPGTLKGNLDTVYPGKMVAVDEAVERAGDAVAPLQFPDVSRSLYPLLQLALQFADEETGIGKQAQGMGDPANDTATATEIAERAEKANLWFGQVMRNIDEGLIEPWGEWAFEFLSEDPQNPLPKLPLRVQALGFSSFQSQNIRSQKLMQVVQLAMATGTGRIDVDELIAEVTRTLDQDADQFLRSDEEMAARAQQGPDPMQQLEMEERAAGIDATRAKTEETRARAMKTGAEADAALTQATADRKTTALQLGGLDRLLEEASAPAPLDSLA